MRCFTLSLALSSACADDMAATGCANCGQLPPDAAVGLVSSPLAAATAPDGAVWVAVHDETYGALVVAAIGMNGGLERAVRVDDGQPRTLDTGLAPALAFGADGHPAVAYLDASSTLQLARHGIGWTTETLASGASGPSLTADSAGGLHLAYRDELTRSLRLLSLSDGGCQPLEQTAGDAPTARHVTADDLGPPTPAGSTADFGEYASIGVSASGAIVASFYDRARGNLMLATCVGKSLDVRIIDGEDAKTGQDTGDVGLWSSLAVDAESGTVGIAYFDRSRGQLRYATSDQGELAITVVDDGATEAGAFTRYVGQGARLAFGVEAGSTRGLPRIAYWDASEPSLRVAALDPFERWLTQSAVTLGAHPGPGLALAIAPNDEAVAVYLSPPPGGVLSVVRCASLSCAE